MKVYPEANIESSDKLEYSPCPFDGMEGKGSVPIKVDDGIQSLRMRPSPPDSELLPLSQTQVLMLDKLPKIQNFLNRQQIKKVSSQSQLNQKQIMSQAGSSPREIKKPTKICPSQLASPSSFEEVFDKQRYAVLNSILLHSPYMQGPKLDQLLCSISKGSFDALASEELMTLCSAMPTSEEL